MNDSVLATFFKCAAVCVCVLIVSIASCSSYQSHLIEQALDTEGNDAIAVGCAFGQNSTGGVCQLAAVKGAQK